MSSHREHWPGRVRAAFADAMGEEAVVDEGFGPVAVDVPVARWVEALTLARDALDCTFFDWLSAVDELTDGFRVVCHLADHHTSGVEHLVIRTLVPREDPVVPSVVPVFAGARWHERETREMFGVDFADEAGERLALEPLLLPENFEGHPLRKDFVLASRVAKPWPGAKEPGESDHQTAAPSRRRTRPPGVPEPEQWGPRPPGSEQPDPLAVASAGPAPRARRTARATPPPATPPTAEETTGPPPAAPAAPPPEATPPAAEPPSDEGGTADA